MVNEILTQNDSKPPAGRAPFLVIFLTLMVFGAAIYFETASLRGRIRNQIAGRDAEVLHAVATMELEEQSAGTNRTAGTNPADQLAVLLRTSRIKGVIATRLFDANGIFVTAFPADVTEGNLFPGDLPGLRKLEPATHYQPRAHLEDLFLKADELESEKGSTAPLLQVEIPLHLPSPSPLVGVAEFVLDGKSIALEFSRLDSGLAIQAAVAFGVGGMIIIFGLGWAFRRLHRVNRLLSERTRVLLQANQELSLAAKTSAVGAVTAHLLHGLTNPLSGLQMFVASRARDSRVDKDGRWGEAVALTERMQQMIQDVVSALKDDDAAYELTWNELMEIVVERVRPLAVGGGVRFESHSAVEGVISNREANLVMMILSNLLHNAIQATSRGKMVRLKFSRAEGNGVRCEVEDEGGGLPEDVKKHLFLPCRSSKANGNGIGLALCKQLANHLGAELALESSTPTGSRFVLRMPASPQVAAAMS